VRQPVLFADGVQSLLACGARLLVEIGPGRTLSALARQCGADAKGATIVDVMPDAGSQASEAFWLTRALARVWLVGADVDWPSLYAGEKRRRVSLPTYPFERQHDGNASRSTEKPEVVDGSGEPAGERERRPLRTSTVSK
jgi:acyl transferase domain-containing protein